MLVEFTRSRIAKIQFEASYSNNDLYKLGLINNKEIKEFKDSDIAFLNSIR